MSRVGGGPARGDAWRARSKRSRRRSQGQGQSTQWAPSSRRRRLQGARAPPTAHMSPAAAPPSYGTTQGPASGGHGFMPPPPPPSTLRPASVPIMPGGLQHGRAAAARGGQAANRPWERRPRRPHLLGRASAEPLAAGGTGGRRAAPSMMRSAADAHRSVSSVQSSRVRGAEGATLPTYGNWVRSHMLSAGNAARATQVGEQAVGLNLKESETLQSFVVHALGAACHSGRSCFIVQNSVRDEQTGEVCTRRVMLDCGIDPLPKSEADAMPDMAAVARLRPDVIVLTHNHADHSGALPHLVTEMGMTDIPILATPPTVDSVRVVASLAPSASGPVDPDELPPHMKALGPQTWFSILCMEGNVALDCVRASVALGDALEADLAARVQGLSDDGVLLADEAAHSSSPLGRSAQQASDVQARARALLARAQRLPPEARRLTVGEALMGLRILRRVGFASAFHQPERRDRPGGARGADASLAPVSKTLFDPRTLPSYMRAYQGYAAAEWLRNSRRDRGAGSDESPGRADSGGEERDTALLAQLGVGAVSREGAARWSADAERRHSRGPRTREEIRAGRMRLSRGGSMALVGTQRPGAADHGGGTEVDEGGGEVMYGPDAAGAEVTQLPRRRQGHYDSGEGAEGTERRRARAPVFSREAWARVAAQMHPVNYRQVWRGKGIGVTLLPAGHMLGAAMVLVEIGSARLLYTGDFLLRGMTHLAPVVPRSLGAVDVLMTESTCGTMMRRDDARISRSAVDTAVRRALSDPRAAVVIPARPFSIIDIAVVMEILWRRLPVDFAASCPVYVAGERAKMYLRVLEAYADLWASDVVRSLLVPADETEQAPHPQPRGRPGTEAGGRQTESVAGRWRPGARMRIGWRHVRFVSEEAAIKMTDARVLLCDHLCASRAVRRWSNPPRSCQPHVLITGAAPPPRTFLGVIATNDVRSIEALGFPDPVTRPVALHVNLWEHASFKQVQELVRAVRPRVLVLIHGVRRCMEDMKRAMERDGTFVGPVLVPRTGEQMTPWTQPLRRNPVIDKRPAGIPLAEWERQKAAEAERRARMELPTALLGDVVGDRFESFGGPSHAHWRSLPPRSSVEVDAAAV